MKVELTVVGIRHYCGGEEGYPQLFAHLPIGCEVILRINRSGERYPGSVSVYDMEMQQIGSISKTDRRFIELEIPQEGVLYAHVRGHSAEHNCIYIEAENTKGFKEPYLRVITPEDDELVFAKTEQDTRQEQLADIVKSQLERLTEQDLAQQQMNALARVLEEYSKLCCTSLDGESSFKRADILRLLKELANKYPALQTAHDDIFEQSKDLGRTYIENGTTYNDKMVEAYRHQYESIYTSAIAKGKKGKSQVDEWLDNLRFTHSGELTRSVISGEMESLARKLSVELMNKYVSCIDSDEEFAYTLYSLNYRLRSIYVLYTRRIKYNYLRDLLCQQGSNAEQVQTSGACHDALPIPYSINTERAQTYFRKAIERGFIQLDEGRFTWVPIGNRGGNSQLAYFCGRVYEYKHSEYGNAGTCFPEEELNKLFSVSRMYSSLTQVHNAKKIQPWRRKIDELFA